MLVNLYRSKTPIAVFSLPLLIGLLALPIFFEKYEIVYHFWNWQNSLDALVKTEGVFHYVLTVVLVATIAHQINNLYNRHSFFSKVTFLPGFFYALGLFSFNLMQFSPVLISHLFLVFALQQFLQLRRQESAKTIIFWGSVFIGLAIAFSSFSILLFLLPCIALGIARPFVWREWVMIILGGMLPLFYYISISYLVKGNFNFQVAEPVESMSVQMDLFEASSYGIFGLVVLGVLLKYVIIMRGEGNRFRKQSQVIFYFLLISVTIWAIGYFVFAHRYLSFLIPLSFFLATAFLHGKRTFLSNGVVIIWLIISAANVLIER